MGKVSFTLSSSYGCNSRSVLENNYSCNETTTNIFVFRSWLTLFIVSVLVCSSTGLPERCDMRPETGECKEFVHKWFFNNNTLQCDTFIYGSCGGNENRFDSEVACMTACVKGYEPPQYFIPVTKKVSPTTTAITPVTKSIDSKQGVVLPPVPLEDRGDELTFEESGHHKVFMFAKKNTFIQLDGNRIPNFQLRICREISFQFRTKLPHGLLVYHSVKDRPEDLEPYALYIIVEKGELKVVHVFGEQSTSVTVGEGLNNDQWHSVAVLIDVHGTRLIAKVDKDSVETQIKGLNTSTNYGVSTDLTPVVLIGGLSSEEKLHGVKYITESFIGCIKNMILSSGKAASDLLPIRPLLATKHENVVEGCVNKCHTRENLCFFGSKCINHYNEYTCDCFGTRYEGELCDIYTATILTLRGSSYVSYRVYDWKDRSHSSANRVSLQFKTLYDDSALFYASGEPDLHYIAVSLKNLSVHIEINLGGGSIITTIGDHLATNYWNNLTIAHYNNHVRIHLNNEAKDFDLPGTFYNLYIDPEIYIGGGPELTKKKGLVSHNNFVGSLKYVYFNDIAIIYELKKGNPKVHYIGVLEPEFYEADVDVIPITLPFPSSHLRLPVNNTESLSLQFDFRSNKSIAILAASNVTTASGRGYWEVRLVNEEIRFELVPNQLNNVTHLTTVKFSSHSTWHSVDLKYNDGSLNLTVDYRHKSSQLFVQQFKMDNTVLIGNGNKNNQGLVGCIRDITVNGERFEARFLTRSKYSVGEISLDNCQLIDPCKRPNACEHGGRCSIKDDHILCDCDGTGYIGKNCHFAIHRKTCEELALLGYTKPSVYWIDIDGNGRFPPAHVKCDFQTPEDSTKTIVEHNLPGQMDVRSFGETDFSVKIKYREFSPEMLQELISHSLHCSQFIKYECYKAPLELHSATWFKSSANKDIVDYIGEVKKGTCPCAVNKTCIERKQSCNCDVSDPMWHSDEAFYNFPNSLGITEMVFLQQKELENDSQGRITLGPLECVETNTQKYVVTFTSSQSYIEVPGWRKGDISFSFRTTGEKAILLYQPPIRPFHPSFMVALTSDFTLTFNFTLNTGRSRELEIKSGRRLNGGEWQKIWIDYNEHHVRFMINTENQMVDLLPEEEFGPFEGSMFIGGATEELLKESSVRQGLIGCFRGLVVNGEILDIYSYMSVHLSEIIKDCKPSCDPNPCKNGATCKELWSTHQCVCENPWAHIGPLCDKNININGLTFITEESYYLPSTSNTEMFQPILTESFLINLRTYVQSAFILYANDHLNNFVQLYIEDGNYVVFAFNSDNEIYNIKIEYPGLNKGKSVQVAVIRSQENITLYVNNKNHTIAANLSLLSEYNNKPWLNPEKEILAPLRPPVEPREYFQIVIGGYNGEHLVATTMNSSLPGYVGCIRGLKIGDEVINLQVEGFVESVKSAFNEFVDMAGDEVLKYSGFKTINGGFTIGKEEKGIKDGCKMKCDEIPCKNQGVCIEDFEKSENTCNCEHTSYFGDSCAEEKGSDFEGESAIRRKYVLDAPVSEVKVQLAFSSSIPHKTNTVLLLLQTEHKRNYNLLVSVNSNGHLTFREDREGSSLIANVEDRNFIDGARHSVYYQRKVDNTTFLLIDRDEISLEPTSVLSLSELPEGEQGSNEVQVGGLNTTDPRFTAYKSFTGCMSNVLVEVNSNIMKPLEEYMLWVKEGTNEVNVVNPQGIRVGQCANFDERKPRPTSSSNRTDENDPQPYSEEPPKKEPYKSLYTERSPQESSSSTIIFLVLFVLFVVIVLGSLCEVYRTHRKYKKRKEEEAEASILWPKSQQYQDPIGNSSIKMTGYKNVPLQDMKTKSQDSKPIIKNDYQPVLVTDEKPLNINGERKGNIDNTDKELAWEPNVDNIGLLPDKSLEDLSQRVPSPVILNNKNTDDYPIKPGQGQIPEGNINGVSNLVHSNSSPLFPTIPEEGLDTRDPLTPDTDPVENKPQSFITGTTLPPIFLNEGFRTFGNPISYLGGPRLQTPSTARTSKESVLSLD